MDSLSPSEVLQHLLGEHALVRVHINVNHPQLGLPAAVLAQHREQLGAGGGAIVLELGYNLPVPIQDWKFGEHALECTCSFGRIPFHCVLPWEAFVLVTPLDESVHCVWPAAFSKVDWAGPVSSDVTQPARNHLRAVK